VSITVTWFDDERLESMYRRFSWRIMSNHVAPWEFETLKSQITDYEQWCGAWSALAAENEARGDEAAAAGNRQTAGEAYIRAGLQLHWASFMFTHNQDEFVAALSAMNAVWAKAADYLSPRMEIITVPFEGVDLHGYLRIPDGVDSAPLVLLLPGADSTKEELFDLSEHILRRGMAVAAFDGPGQGTVSLSMKMRPDYEKAVMAILDELLTRPRLDENKVALTGISYGGLFSLRTAAIDPRVKAVVSMSSWYTPKGRFDGMERLTRTGQFQYIGPDPAATMAEITLAGVLDKVTVPLLQVFGGKDEWSPVSNGEMVSAEIAGPVTTVVYPDGVHILNNVWFKARPMVGDWLAARMAELS
jgi:pimeloyl-ACP methyl ester carboxylesterase